MKKTAEMYLYKISWNDVIDELGTTKATLLNMRNSDDPEKHRAIKMAIDRIVERKK